MSKKDRSIDDRAELEAQFLAHEEAAEASAKRWHAEASAVLGFDTKALERKLFGKKTAPRITGNLKKKKAR